MTPAAIDYVSIVLARSDASGDLKRTTYDSRIAPLGQIAGALLRDMGAQPVCPAPNLPEGYRCDGCDCERSDQLREAT